MPVNSDQTLIALLKNKAVFFFLMDKVHQETQNPSMEFKISDFETLLVKQSKTLETTKKKQILEALSLENMERNGLLSYLDKRTGRFRLQDFVLEMLRHLDSKRLRELSSAELNQLMKQLEECYRQVSDINIMWIPGDPLFEELLVSVYHCLQHVASRLKSNVRALRGQAERLASIVDEQKFTDLERTDQVRVALREILRIHERHVTPTLQFLDERLDIHRSITELHGESAPMALVKNIINRFSERKLTDHVTRMQRIQFHILLMGREVGDIAKGLDTYVKYAEAERRRYNRTEQLYNELREAVQEKQTGQLRDFMLKPTHPIFQNVRELGNLKNFCRTQASNINWPSAQGTHALNEVLRVRVKKGLLNAKPTTVILPQPLTEEEIEERQAVERILNAMKKFDYSRSHQDIYLRLHEHLNQQLQNYSLNRLIDALPFLSGYGNIALEQPAHFNEIEFKGFKLRYRQRNYRANAENSQKEA